MKRCSNDFVDDRTVLKPHGRRSNDARTTLIGPGTVHPGFDKDRSDIDCFWNDSIPALIHFNRIYPVLWSWEGSIFNYSLGVVNNTPHPELRLFGNKTDSTNLRLTWNQSSLVKQRYRSILIWVRHEMGSVQMLTQWLDLPKRRGSANSINRSNQQFHKH